MSSSPRSLYLIPSLLGDTPVEKVLPKVNLDIIRSLDHFIVEEERTARRFLIRCGYDKSLDTVEFFILNEHTPVQEIPVLFLSSGESNLGLLSEAGVPAVADPGSALVEEAHRLGIKVIPLVGPSSLIMALMASGLNGQNFAFNGYLPVKNPARASRIRLIERRSEVENQSQIFIEAPYRNNQLVSALIEVCKPGTRLCIATNITLPDEWIRTKSIRDWQNLPPPDLKRQPSVFILQA
jgi:16S rRNA (cytidine1402-2'-O)-methyltransferase